MKKKFLFLITFICSLFLFNQNVYASETQLYPYKLDYYNIDPSSFPNINNMPMLELYNYIIAEFNANVVDKNIGLLMTQVDPYNIFVSFYDINEFVYSYVEVDMSSFESGYRFTNLNYQGKFSSETFLFSNKYASSSITFEKVFSDFLKYIKKASVSSFIENKKVKTNIGISDIYTNASQKNFFPIYSSTPMYYPLSGSNAPFVYDNQVILPNQKVPTYFSSQYSDSKNIKSEIFNYMGFFVYQVPVESINDLRVEFSYDVADEWSSYFNDVDNTLDYLVKARRTEVDYNYFHYTIDSACEVIPNITKKDNHFSGVFTFDCSKATLLDKYDYFIIHFIQRYSLPISNVKLTTNFGNIFINEITRDPSYVYDSFVLNENDKLLYSSAKDDTILYYSTNLDKSLYISIVDFNNIYSNSIHSFITSPVGSLEKINYTFGKTNGYGFLAYPYYRPDTINLFFDYDRGYISVSDKNSLSYFFNGSWRTGYRPIANPTTSDSFSDISGYFGVVTNFIDSFSANINDFSVVLQNIYNLAPSYIQTFIFVVFILSMTYILYELLRK